ncbi:lysophospholipase L1-like esterase [Nocardioides salarius]|uniref:Lysophospholipase L1-like esterase n=1 Tax=Nocardioides salarius TaxID=374513 RepID=A0ABS2M538_9ACTN|nr:SGNH/GDSL hydrolase family protein [Nocardioides salarius]MBM7506305.1 lysophospholipase L1-like esterase [Nocardioides salarius]
MAPRLHGAALLRAVAPLAVVGALLAPTGPAASAPSIDPAARASRAAPAYVALGDSYSSGTGTRSYVADGTSCLRSSKAYPSLVAARRGYTLDLRACSGAVVADVTSAQLGALSAATAYVTISVGGNDAGFADVLTTCATPWWMASCSRAVDRARSFINATLPGRLATLYSQIRTRAPQARVVVVGYPRVFGDEDCNALTFFSGSERSSLNATADLLNRRLREQAAARGFAFADPTGRFSGHAVCADAEWINGLSYPVVESYHPNGPGHGQGYLPVVEAQLPAGLARPTGATRVAPAEIARTQRPYAELDAGIEPAVVRAPDLDSRRAQRAARRAGVDIERWQARQQR